MAERLLLPADAEAIVARAGAGLRQDRRWGLQGGPFRSSVRRGMTRRYLDQRLKLPLLRVADALEVHGSPPKAASALGVGQPALTRSLAELGEITGTRLFERHARGVRLRSYAGR